MKICYFAPIDWNFIRQRPQHLAAHLSRVCEFFYIQPLGLRSLKISDAKRLFMRLCQFFRKTPPNCKGPRIQNLLFFPFRNEVFHKANSLLLEKQLKKNFGPQSIFWITTPHFLLPDLLEKLPHRFLIYEMMDDYPKIHPTHAHQIFQVEKHLIQEADLVIVSSSFLKRKATSIAPYKKILLVTNGVDFDFFQKAPLCKPRDLRDFSPIAGYVGTLENWLDWDMIDFMASENPEVDFVFVGPQKMSSPPRKKNIHYLGVRDYRQIPAYIQAFDVCLIPFVQGSFSDSVNPVKLYEYFSLGKPVVASQMEELMPFRELLYMAKKEEDSLSQLKKALLESGEFLKSKRREIARQNSWSSKAQEISLALEIL